MGNIRATPSINTYKISEKQNLLQKRVFARSFQEKATSQTEFSIIYSVKNIGQDLLFFLFCDFNFFDYSWFTVFCQLLLYSKVTQNIYILFFTLFSIMFHYKWDLRFLSFFYFFIFYFLIFLFFLFYSSLRICHLTTSDSLVLLSSFICCKLGNKLFA